MKEIIVPVHAQKMLHYWPGVQIAKGLSPLVIRGVQRVKSTKKGGRLLELLSLKH